MIEVIWRRRAVSVLSAATCLLMLLATSCGQPSISEDEHEAQLRENDRETLVDYFGHVREYQQQVRPAMSRLHRALRRCPERMILPHREELGGVVLMTQAEVFTAESRLHGRDPGPLESLPDASILNYAHAELERSADKRSLMLALLEDAVSWTPRKSQWRLFDVAVAADDAANAYDAFWDKLEETADALDMPIPFKRLPDYRWFGDPLDYLDR